MIEFKIATTSAAVLNAVSELFAVMAREAAAATAPIEAAARAVEQVEQVEAPAFDVEEIEEVEQLAELPPPPPPTNGPAATIHALATAGVELDSDGFPWDHRIHSSTKSKLKDGTWKLLRGVDQGVVDSIRAEFRQNMSAAITVAPTVATPAAALPPAPAVDPAPDQPAPAPAPAVQAAAPVAGTRPTNPGLLFTSTLALYAELEKAGKIAAGSGDAWAREAGLTNMAGLITRPDLCGQFYDQLTAIKGA